MLLKKKRLPAAGLVGVIPAFTMLEPPQKGPVLFSAGQLILWSLALAFIGVFCAVPLRTQTILREKLRFPSGEYIISHGQQCNSGLLSDPRDPAMLAPYSIH